MLNIFVKFVRSFMIVFQLKRQWLEDDLSYSVQKGIGDTKVFRSTLVSAYKKF